MSSSTVPGDLCKRGGGELAAEERSRLAVEAAALHDASGLDNLLHGLEPERRCTDDPEPRRAGCVQREAHNGRVELELRGSTVARFDL